MCLAVLEREALGWDAFRPHLVAAIEREPEADYYDSFAVALDKMLPALDLVRT